MCRNRSQSREIKSSRRSQPGTWPDLGFETAPWGRHAATPRESQGGTARGPLLQLPAAPREVTRTPARLPPQSLTFYKITSRGPGLRRAVAVIRTHWTQKRISHLVDTQQRGVSCIERQYLALLESRLPLFKEVGAGSPRLGAQMKSELWHPQRLLSERSPDRDPGRRRPGSLSLPRRDRTPGARVPRRHQPSVRHPGYRGRPFRLKPLQPVFSVALEDTISCLS